MCCAAGLHGLDKALDADADRAAGVTFVELEHEHFFVGIAVHHAHHFVGQDGIMAATEAHYLGKFHVRVSRRDHRGAQHAQVERVLHFHAGVARNVLVIDARERFCCQDRDAHRGKMACDVVVDEHVGVVGAARNHDGKAVVRLHVVENLLAFFEERGAVVVERLFAFGHRLVQSLSVDVPVVVEPVDGLAAAEFRVCPVENRLVHRDAVVLFGFVRVLADVRITLHDGADGRGVKLGVVAGERDHHREEDAVDLLVDEAEHVAVDELGREADRVRRHAVEARFEHLVVALAADDDGVTECREERLPVGEAVPEFEDARDADGLAVLWQQDLRGIVLDQELVRALDHVRHGLHLPVDFGDELLGGRIVRVGGDFAAFAAVAGHETLSVAEGHDGAGAVVGAVLAKLPRLVVPAEGTHGFEADELALEFRFGLALFFHELLGQERDTDGAHFARAFRTDGLEARILFEGAEHGVVLERTALHDDLLAERVQVADADNLRKDVVDDGAADTRDDVFGLLAVALFRDDGTVHEHGAARAELGWALGVECHVGNLFHRDAEAAGVGFDE